MLYTVFHARAQLRVGNRRYANLANIVIGISSS
jgi:hypothetical protein